MSGQPRPKIKVAIIGGGPAGLGAGIALSRNPHVEWNLYEKKPEISEIGNGLTIQPNTWRMLEKLGAAHHLKADDFFRPAGGHHTQHRWVAPGQDANALCLRFITRDGRTGRLVLTSKSDRNTPPHREGCRAHRAKLQNALVREVERKRLWVGRKLVAVDQLPTGRLLIAFEDGLSDEVDLLVGADGIRSAVRRFAFPEHGIHYTGSTAYRTLVKSSDAVKINGLPRDVIFWHGSEGKWVYTCPLAGNDWEVTCAIKEPGGETRTSWGKQASVQHFTNSFSEMCPPVQQILALSTYVEQYDYFAGPRVESIVKNGNVALIGDASHPLSGAFGAGAGFALEDAYTLGRAISWAAQVGLPLADALSLLDDIRSPHYRALYGVLDKFATVEVDLSTRAPKPDISSEIEEGINRKWDGNSTWMHHYKVDEVFDERVNDSRQREHRL